VRIETEPILIAAVDVGVGAIRAKVGHQRRDRVGDQAHLVLTATQRGGDLLVGLQRLAQALVAGLQLGGAGQHAGLQLAVGLAQGQLGATLLGHIGIQGDEAVSRQGLPGDAQHAAIGAHTLDVVRHELAGLVHAGGHGGVNVVFAVFATLGVVADEALERGAHKGQISREIKQLQEGAVPGDQLQISVEHGETLVEQVEPRLQGLLTPVAGVSLQSGI